MTEPTAAPASGVLDYRTTFVASSQTLTQPDAIVRVLGALDHEAPVDEAVGHFADFGGFRVRPGEDRAHGLRRFEREVRAVARAVTAHHGGGDIEFAWSLAVAIGADDPAIVVARWTHDGDTSTSKEVRVERHADLTRDINAAGLDAAVAIWEALERHWAYLDY